MCLLLNLLSNMVYAADSADSADSAVLIRDAWIREAPPNSTTLAGYMTLENQSDKIQSLISASATGFSMIMIHLSRQKNGMAHMMHQKQVNIPANGKIMFTPGSYHLMLMQPKRPLHAGDQVTINLIFAGEQKYSVIFNVYKEAP